MKSRQFIEASFGENDGNRNNRLNSYLVKVKDLREFVDSISWAGDDMKINISNNYSHEDGALLFELDERSPNGLGN